MKLCNIIVENSIHLGAVTEGGVADLTAAGCPFTMEEVISSGSISDLEAVASAAPVTAAPVYANILTRPGKLLCVGLNYIAHTQGINMKVPEQPVLFSKFADALVPSGADVVLPPWEVSYDYEAELVIVMGRTAWNVSREQAMDYVFGYTCGNDFSCRDAQLRSGQWLIGKAMPGFGPCGPCIVTADSFDPAEKAVKSYVNGELRQDGNTRDMIFKCADVISYASKYVRLEPGDLIFTGTPSGVALEKREDKRRWLEPGDRVDIRIEDIGTLTNYMK